MLVSYEIGQRWLYKRTFIQVGLDATTDYPDTIRGYAFFQVVDTETIDDARHFIIEGVDYDIGETSVDSFHQKWAVHLSDSVMKVLQYSSDVFGFSDGPFKQRASSAQPSFPAKLRQLLYTKAQVEYLPGFRSEVYPLRFPLVKDQKWIYRYGNQSYGRRDMYRKYLGQETVLVPAGSIMAYKIDWLLSEYWGEISVDTADLVGYDWYDSRGLVKRFLQSGETEVIDSVGAVIGTVSQVFDILEFVGEFGIDSDTLHPYGE